MQNFDFSIKLKHVLFECHFFTFNIVQKMLEIIVKVKERSAFI